MAENRGLLMPEITVSPSPKMPWALHRSAYAKVFTINPHVTSLHYLYKWLIYKN